MSPCIFRVSSLAHTYILEILHRTIVYIKSKGIKDVYEIVKIRTITSSEAKQIEEDPTTKDEIRLAFVLRYSHQLFNSYTKVNTHKMINYTFIDTTFEEINVGDAETDI